MTAFTRTIPVLRSFDEAKARECYQGFLGFTVDFEHRFAPDMPLTMGVWRARCGCTSASISGMRCRGRASSSR